ncbi:MAG: cation:proton antiporter [Planctomycetota bacterium]
MLLPLLIAAGEVTFLPELTAIVVATAVFGYLCQRFGIVPIVGFLLAGVLVGPGGIGGRLGLLDDEAVIQAVADYGVILLLFTIGLEFSLDRLAAIRKLIFGAGTLQVVGTIAVVAGIVSLFADLRAALFTGCLVSLSSTAIVLKLLGPSASASDGPGQASLGVLIFQDLAVVAMVMLVPMLAAPAEGETTSLASGLGDMGWALVKAGAVIAAVLLLARRAVPVVMEYVARTCRGEIFFLTTIAICIATAWLTSLAGVSAALGAFLGGLMVSESKFRHHAIGEVMPLQILFSAAFFVSVGMLLDPAFVLQNIGLIAGIVIAVAAVKTLITTLAVKVVGRSWRQSAGVGLILGQVGEFAFVLATVGGAAGLVPLGRADGFDVFIAASVVLMLLTPVMASLGLKLAGGADAGNDEAGLRGHIVIDGFGDLGRRLAGELKERDVPCVVVTMSPAGATDAESAGFETVRGETDRSGSLEAAATLQAKAVVIADDDAEKATRATSVARWWLDQGGRGGRVIVVADDAYADELRDAGAHVVLAPAESRQLVRYVC